MSPPLKDARVTASTQPVPQSAPPAPWRTAWITGASSGIGRELARQLARRGVRVAISARSPEGLAETAAGQDRIEAFPLDVTDAAAVHDTLARITARFGALDLVILNAGILEPMGARDYSAGLAARAMAVNYTGITHALEPLLPRLIAQGHGHVALVASMAGYRGLPSGAAYAPAKAAVIALAEVLRPELKAAGVTLSVVNPGFVETPLTEVNPFPMPFLTSAPRAARRIIRGLERRRFEIAFPWPLVASMKALRALPYRPFFWLVEKFMLGKTTRGK